VELTSGEGKGVTEEKQCAWSEIEKSVAWTSSDVEEREIFSGSYRCVSSTAVPAVLPS